MTEDRALHDAYLKTVYRVVDTDEPFDICVGHRCVELDRLLKANGLRDWAFVTAANPRSRRLPDRENATRNAELKRSLQQAGWRTMDGVGLPRGPEWPPEHSILILGIDRDAAVRLALRWEQNAIVCGTIGKPAELLWVI